MPAGWRAWSPTRRRRSVFKRENDTEFRDTVRDAAARQFRLDARPADLDRRDLAPTCWRARWNAARSRSRSSASPPAPGRAGRAARRWLAAGPAAAAGPAERPAPHRLQVRRRALAAGAAEPRADDEGGAAEGEHRRRGAGMGAPPADRRGREARSILMVISDGAPVDDSAPCRSTRRTTWKSTCAT